MPAGFYGKIPATGDFVSRDLPRELVQRWDRWMARALPDALSAGGGDSGMCWAFLAERGVFGLEPMAGVWRLSRDRVGRRFPLLIALPGATPEPQDPWYAAAAGLLDAAIDGGLRTELLASRVAALPRPGRRTLPAEAACFWPALRPEVPPLRFASITLLARDGLAQMLPPLDAQGVGGDGEDGFNSLDGIEERLEPLDLSQMAIPVGEPDGGLPEPGEDEDDPLAALLADAESEPVDFAPEPAPLTPSALRAAFAAGAPAASAAPTELIPEDVDLPGEGGGPLALPPDLDDPDPGSGPPDGHPAEAAPLPVASQAGPVPSPAPAGDNPLLALLDWAADETPDAIPPAAPVARPPVARPADGQARATADAVDQVDIDDLFDLGDPDPGRR